MIELKKILVPTDFSKFSEHALAYGCELASKFGAELHLLYVVTDALLMYTAAQTQVGAEQVIQEEKAHGQRQLEQLPGAAWSSLKVVRSVEVGVPLMEILNYVKEEEIDLLVMGTHGRTGLSHVFLGSVGEKVVRKASCPVLTVRHPEHEFIKP